MRPKFEVGEVVLVVSPIDPAVNGEYTILDVGFSLYRFQPDYDIGLKDGRRALESSLRKKHQPGEMSFDSLMASLSSPKLLTHQPEGVAPL